MTALAGIWRFDGRPDAAEKCARMLVSQEIYGPHDRNLWSGESIAIGRALFRTLPEDTYDRQPLRSADGGRSFVADVRLDNRDDLVAQLGIPTARAGTLPDAAILFEAVERWAENALQRVEGDFAFALWDEATQRLLLARDCMGARPLHFHCGKDFFAFASMPKGLHAVPEIPYAPNEQAMAEFVTLLPERRNQSFFKGVDRLLAGQFAIFTRAGVKIQNYWQPKPPGSLRLKDDDAYVDAARHHLERAVRARLRGANGVVGAHLSAGYDSASVATTAARVMAPSGGRVVAFTHVPREGYDGPAPPRRIGDEGPLAAATAAMHSNIEHVRIATRRQSPLANMDRNAFLFERPVLNLCNHVWIESINSEARSRKIGIVLTGQMGNMTLSYSGTERLAELLGSGHLFTLMRECWALLANKDMRFPGMVAHTIFPFLPAWMWRMASRIMTGTKWDVTQYSAINGERLASMDMASLARERGLDPSYRPWKNGFAMRRWVLQRVDLGNYNHGILAGWGIDQRDATSDKAFTEFCLSLPQDQYLKDGLQRRLAKRVLADRLPREVLYARHKGLQAVDWHEGLTDARPEVTAELERLTACAPAGQILDLDRLKKNAANWPTSGWETSDVVFAYRLAMLRGISAGHFLRKVSGGNQ